MKKNCCGLITDGEDDRNSQDISVSYSSVAVLFHVIKGKPLKRWLFLYLWLGIKEQSLLRLLHFQDCLLTKEDEKLPFAGHVACSF